MLLVLICLCFIVICGIFLARYKKYKQKNLKFYFKDFNKLPKLASHRGYGKKGPVAENTLEAFQKSTKDGFRFHELDARITRDGIPVVFHGPDLSVTTDGFGHVESYTIDDLKKIDWGYYLSKGRKGKKTPILTLEKYLVTIGKQAITNIELKKELQIFSRKLENNILSLIEKLRVEDRIFLSSFNPFVLRYIKKKAPELPVGLLVEPGIFFNIILFFLRIIILPDFLHAPAEMVTEKRIKKWKKLNYGIVVWTVNDYEKAKELFKWGADIVITDNIAMMKKYKKDSQFA